MCLCWICLRRERCCTGGAPGTHGAIVLNRNPATGANQGCPALLALRTPISPVSEKECHSNLPPTAMPSPVQSHWPGNHIGWPPRQNALKGGAFAWQVPAHSLLATAPVAQPCAINAVLCICHMSRHGALHKHGLIQGWDLEPGLSASSARNLYDTSPVPHPRGCVPLCRPAARVRMLPPCFYLLPPLTDA